ncbi:diacylglycerol/lipid kinase family protein [Pseudoclavibacter helvolus]|uniref:diacylglycerol/lipid kinase family protein n=1 Tax=Pseudoclavibacter helvolus TaxID=255205 RepID=UPI0037356ADE
MPHTAPQCSDKLAAIVVNPVKVDTKALRAAVAESAERYEWPEALWFETTVDDPGAGQTKEAIAAGATMVIAAGGDGTVRLVAETLAGSDVALGVVPGGTGNLLARNIGIEVAGGMTDTVSELMQNASTLLPGAKPSNLPMTTLARAVEVAFGGVDARIDLGWAAVEREDKTRERMAFTVMGGVGVDAGMIANTSEDLKKKVGWVAYLGGIARSVANGPNFHLRLRVDGKAHARSLRAATVMVGNCGLMPGGLHLLPDAEIDDGRLDLAIMRPNGFIGWLQIYGRIVVQSGIMRRTDVGRRILLQGRKRVRALTYAQVEEVTFRLDSGPEEFEVDGDAAGQITAARIWIEPASLTVRTPKPILENEGLRTLARRLGLAPNESTPTPLDEKTHEKANV